MGKALLRAAEEDAQERGAKGLVVWGVSLPVFMRASWFRKQGYVQVDSDGMVKLLWKKFREDAVEPKWARKKRKPSPAPGKVVVTCLRSGWCPGQNVACERAKRALAGFKDLVLLEEIDTFEKQVGMEWGTADALYVDDKLVRTGPPPSYEKIRRTIEKRVRRIRRGARLTARQN
jgi:hypothetical protein